MLSATTQQAMTPYLNNSTYVRHTIGMPHASSAVCEAMYAGSNIHA
jgi:hypothetical protein